MKKIFFWILIILIIVPMIQAKQEGHMNLLAVKENTDEGSTADLFLEIKPGRGRVFLETIPLSKMDTQISTRFAKDIACDYIEENCENYDFFYTIKSESPIIGGPSAGAAIAILTISVLEDIEVDEDFAITGTINSGDIIGPVGGLKAKIEAASSMGIKNVIIPKGERFSKEENMTLDLDDHAKKFNVTIIEAGDLTDALFHITERRFKEDIQDIKIDEEYRQIMKYLADDLCNRTTMLKKELSLKDVSDDISINKNLSDIKEKAENLSEKGEKAFETESFYSSASYCFGANVKYRELLVSLEENKNFDSIEKDIENFSYNLSKRKIKTINDLQIFMIVKERLKDAKGYLDDSRKMCDEKDEESCNRNFGYAIERLYSAGSWNKFFEMDGEEFNLDKSSLKESCINKISEAEERYHYANLYLPGSLEETKKEIDHAYDDKENEDFELCLFKASKAKAEADVILGVIGVDEEQADFVLSNKLEAVKRVISEQNKKDMFPVLGYSYYEYAENLKESDKFSSLLYAEYALELSNLDIYFEKEEIKFSIVKYEYYIKQASIFFSGLILGILIIILYERKDTTKKQRKKNKKIKKR